LLNPIRHGNSSSGLGFFYCNHHSKQHPRIILGSIIKQLAVQSRLPPDSRCLENIKRLYKGHKSISSYSRFDLDLFVMNLHSIAAVFKDVYIVVDGLDQCKPRDDLLGVLNRIARSGVRVLVVSRMENDIGKVFAQRSTIQMDDHGVKMDIEKYIDDQLEGEKWRLRRPQMKDAMKRRLLRKSAGMYIFPITNTYDQQVSVGCLPVRLYWQPSHGCRQKIGHQKSSPWFIQNLRRNGQTD
jgi:hypothetical protein